MQYRREDHMGRERLETVAKTAKQSPRNVDALDHSQHRLLYLRRCRAPHHPPTKIRDQDVEQRDRLASPAMVVTKIGILIDSRSNRCQLARSVLGLRRATSFTWYQSSRCSWRVLIR
ncbi:hypothetical protein PV11_09029 [Exophiala sideris]|uniref:Uncharacterized protein n=1 Tax=Exophiala sideris TaxID=1016849 RepID=A0A0D1Y8T2_9EURO|nr:hypothetical protein PV11_09029 [Exophiala sideris]